MTEDEDMTAARRNQVILKAVVKPRSLPRKYQIGDGDICPLDPKHGPMFVRDGRQHCPDQSHDGVWAEGQRGSITRSSWPLHTFDEAVRSHFAGKPADLIDIEELLN